MTYLVSSVLFQTLKHHIAGRMLPACSFQPNLTYHIDTKHGLVNVRSDGRQIMVGSTGKDSGRHREQRQTPSTPSVQIL